MRVNGGVIVPPAEDGMGYKTQHARTFCVVVALQRTSRRNGGERRCGWRAADLIVDVASKTHGKSRVTRCAACEVLTPTTDDTK